MTVYTLDGHTPVPCEPHELERIIGDIAARTVAKTFLAGGVEVSTVFLGVDHQFGDGPPILFETMVFRGALSGEQERYATWDEAAAGHARIVARLGLS